MDPELPGIGLPVIPVVEVEPAPAAAAQPLGPHEVETAEGLA